MSPEYGTRSLLGPLARDRSKKAGMMASLALVLAASVVSPAAAAARSVGDHTAGANHYSGGGKDKCKQPKHRLDGSTAQGGKDKCQGPTGPRVPRAHQAPAPRSTYHPQGNVEYRTALSADGRFYAGIRDLTGSNANPMLWTDLSTYTGYPAGDAAGVPCGASVDEHQASGGGAAHQGVRTRPN